MNLNGANSLGIAAVLLVHHSYNIGACIHPDLYATPFCGNIKWGSGARTKT